MCNGENQGLLDCCMMRKRSMVANSSEEKPAWWHTGGSLLQTPEAQQWGCNALPHAWCQRLKSKEQSVKETLIATAGLPGL